jgi:hypothetical protein
MANRTGDERRREEARRCYVEVCQAVTNAGYVSWLMAQQAINATQAALRVSGRSTEDNTLVVVHLLSIFEVCIRVTVDRYSH